MTDDFEARSQDELSLSKGDRIELIERDDDFGDGWYLGKHLQNGKTGLFPEGGYPFVASFDRVRELICLVYTTTTPRPINITATTVGNAANLMTGTASNVHAASRPSEPINTAGATPSPLNTSLPAHRTPSIANSSISVTGLNGTGTRGLNTIPQKSNEDSIVMNETLSVIDEHITDMHLPRAHDEDHNMLTRSDSASEYSSHIDQRLSYIAGHETDEEERDNHTEQEVSKWTCEQVAEHLEEIGVEHRHCKVFKQQEISGEVLLAMDQASIFMKEFDLGLVGARLRTWHKIKALQDEVRAATITTSAPRLPRDTLSGSTIANTWDNAQHLSNGPSTSSTLINRLSESSASQPLQRPDVPSPRPSPSPSAQRSRAQTTRDAISTPSSFIYKSGMDSPGRPSAACIRDLNHTRRHSAADLTATDTPATPSEENRNLHAGPSRNSQHKKAPSLDRNWSMGSPSSVSSARPGSIVNTGMEPNNDHNSFDPNASNTAYKHSASRDLDRGYVSSGETEAKKGRNVLRKRDIVSASHSRHSSYQGDKRMSYAGTKRHSRFGSVDSIKDTMAAMASPASKMYSGNGNGVRGHFRTSSASESPARVISPGTLTSPTVTKLEYDDKSPSMKALTSSPNTAGSPSPAGSPISAVGPKGKPRIGLRAISDAVTGNERAIVHSPVSVPSPVRESARQSPARTGSTTPSGASQSVERESTDASSKRTSGTHTALTSTTGTRRKSKKETSAYTRGLEAKNPAEQMVGCDYSGWMKKKSSNVMTTWKPRLFVLRGRRLSYYYAENDTQERGLIDISSHRVLPADNDIITSIHAAVTGARSSPVSPATSHTATMASKEAAAEPASMTPKASDATFIFKLVPPRSGLSRAVNFTKPTVHYFAVDNIRQGRLWMAALMKATIDRDENQPVAMTYQQETISLAKARKMRHRPPALMGLDEKSEARDKGPKSDETGLAIQGLHLDDVDDNRIEHKRTGSLDVKTSNEASEEVATEAAGER